MIVKFSVLSYYPSFMTEECINLGVIISTEDNKVDFKSIRKWNRLKAFDDEIDIEWFKAILSGMRQEILNFQHPIENFIKYYVNELKFSEVMKVEVDGSEFSKWKEDTCKIYLKFDYDNKERLNDKEIKEYAIKYLKSKKINYSRAVVGTFDETIQFDFIMKDKYAFKVFTFKDKSFHNVFYHLKAWRTNAEELKEKYKVIFIHDLNIHDETYIKVKKLLSMNSVQLIDCDKLIDLISEINKEVNDDQIKIEDCKSSIAN